MPDIALLNPVVLNGVIEKFMAPETLVGRTRLMGADRMLPNPDPTVAYDIIQAARQVAKPNIPNAEAHIIAQLGLGHIAASMIYLRDKKVFSPTTIRWLRAPGQLAGGYAEQAVLRELKDLNDRFEKFAEFCIWQAFISGQLNFTGGGVSIALNYQFSATHLPTASVAWGTPGADIIGDIKAWKRLTTRDGQAVANLAFLNEVAMANVLKDPGLLELYSNELKTEYLKTSQVKGLLGVDWTVYDIAYVDDNGVVTQFIPDNKFVLVSEDNGDRWYLYEGPSADMSAPEGHIGKYAKTWEEDDPSARQYLLEWHLLPAIWRPEQCIGATIG